MLLYLCFVGTDSQWTVDGSVASSHWWQADSEDTPEDTEDSSIKHTGERRKQENDVMTRDGSLASMLAQSGANKKNKWKMWVSEA